MNKEYEYRSEIDTSHLIERLGQLGPTVIAFEGGPCGGKTTIANLLAKEAENQGRPVVILPEVATELGAKLLEHGLSIPYLAQHDRPGYLAFQKDLISRIALDIEDAKQQYAGTNALIIADRSDNGAYMTRQEYEEVLADTGHTAPPHATLVDTIVYLPSLAHEDASRYESLMQTNIARYESSEGAVTTCLKNLDTVSMHPDIRVYWGTDFDTKIGKVLHDVLQKPESSTSRTIINGQSLAMLTAIFETVETTPLEASAVTRTEHEGFSLEHRISETGHHMYYYFGQRDGELHRSALNAKEHAALRELHCYDQQSFIYQRYVVSHNGGKSMAAVKHYNDGQWTLEIQ